MFILSLLIFLLFIRIQLKCENVQNLFSVFMALDVTYNSQQKIESYTYSKH